MRGHRLIASPLLLSICILLAMQAHTSDLMSGRLLLASVLYSEFCKSRTSKFDVGMGFGGIEFEVATDKCPLAAVVRKLENKVKAHPSSSNLANYAIAQLADGHVNRAITNLESISRKDPDDIVALTDLSAAYLVRNKIENQPHDLVLSIDASRRAIALDAASAEARFNLALALEKSLLLSQADTEWSNFLELDRTSVRAQVALFHLATVSRRRLHSDEFDVNQFLEARNQAGLQSATREHRQPMRIFGEEKIFYSWARNILDGNEDRANKELDKAQAIGEVLAEGRDGDQMLLQATEAIRQDEGDAHRRMALMEGYLQYQRATELVKSRLHKQALPFFRRAYHEFAIGGSPFRYWALVNVAVCEVNLGRYEETLRDLSLLRQSIAMEPFPILLGRVEWIMGLAHLKLARLSISYDLYLSALKKFRAAGELENVAALYFLLAENLRLQGEVLNAWRYRYEAIRYASLSGSYTWHSNALYDSAEAAIREGLLGVALAFQSEMISLASLSKEPILEAESLLRRARTYLAENNQSAARQDIDAAERLLGKISSPDRRKHVEVDFWSNKADLLMLEDPNLAEVYLSKVLARLSENGERFRLADILRRRALAREAIGRVEDARRDLMMAVSEVIFERQKITNEPLTVLYSDRTSDIFELMIDQEIGIADYAGALKYVELKKCFDCTQEENLAAESTESLVAQIPADTAVISYSVKRDKVMIFSIVGSRVFLSIVPLGVPRLESLIENLPALLEKGAPQCKETIRLMSEALIAPVAPTLRGYRRLLIVPDGPLFRVPFSVLNHGGRLLIEDFEVTVSPSLISSIGRGGSRHRVESVLILADSNFGQSKFSSLLRLPGSRLEADVIAAQYSYSKVLAGSYATKRLFLMNINRFDVVHVAVHSGGGTSITDPAFLILTPDGNTDTSSGLLYSQDIAKLNLKCLVILASCRAAGGALSASGINVNLARYFLNGGAKGVLASLWQVDDNAAGPFMTRLHQLLAAGTGIEESLRTVQLECATGAMKERCPPSLWGSFEMFK